MDANLNLTILDDQHGDEDVQIPCCLTCTFLVYLRALAYKYDIKVWRGVIFPSIRPLFHQYIELYRIIKLHDENFVLYKCF